MAGSDEQGNDAGEGGNGPRMLVSGQEPGAGAAEVHLRDLAAVIPGAFYRFRATPGGEYRLDFMTEGIRGLTGLSREVDLTDFNEWTRRVPEGYVDPILDSIDRSRQSMTTWIHEWPMDVPAGRIWLQGLSEPHRQGDGSVVWNGLLLDVTAGKKAAAELSRVETDYRSIFENTTEGIFRTSREGRLLDANWPLVRMHRCTSKAQLIGAVGDLATDWYVHAEDRQRILAILDEHDYLEGYEAEIYRVGTGERFWSQENSRAIRDADGHLLYYQGTVRDVTAEHRARRLAERRGELLELIARDEPLSMTLNEIVGALEAYRTRITAAILVLADGLIKVEAAPGLSNVCIEVLHATSPSQVGGVVAAAMRAEGPCLQSREQGTAADGGRLAAALRDGGHDEAIVIPVRDREGTVLGLLMGLATTVEEVDTDLRGLFHEMAQITAIALEQHRLGQRLLEQAQYDALTGLPNRLLLTDRMQQLLLEAGRNERTVGVILLDLDEFKQVNDTLGHDAGDTLLREVAQRLQRCVRASDTVARFGGDEFVIVLPVDGPERTTELAERILSTLALSITSRGHEVAVGASMGISLFPRDGLTADNLVQAADTAMYAAKKAGRNQYQFFDQSLNRAASRRFRVETELRTALDGSELVMYYQPRVWLADNGISGAEALLRWHHPERGVVLPGEFMGVAQQSTLMAEIDRYVLESVAQQVAAWQASGHVLPVSLNLSVGELQRIDFGRMLAQVLVSHGVDPAGIELEVTEHMVMQDFEHASRQLRDLRERAPGIRIALDNFGTGYSSLRYLAQLPVDTLKIDRSFVADLVRPDAGDTAGAVARAIVELGGHLGLHVIAEGIEAPEQVDRLRALGCVEGQGYWFSRPLPVEAFEDLLAS